MFDVQSREFVTTVGVGLLLSLGATAIWALPRNQRTANAGLTFLVILFGAAVGALIGTLASPEAASEKESFKTVAGLIGAFLTGWVWKSFEADIRASLQKAQASRIVVTQAIACVIAIFLGAFVLYAYREYASKPSPSEAQKALDALRGAIDKAEKSLKDK